MLNAPINAPSLSIGTSTKDRAPPSFDRGDRRVLGGIVSRVAQPLRLHYAGEMTAWLKCSTLPEPFPKITRSANLGHRKKCFAFKAEQYPEIRFADARGI